MTDRLVETSDAGDTITKARVEVLFDGFDVELRWTEPFFNREADFCLEVCSTDDDSSELLFTLLFQENDTAMDVLIDNSVMMSLWLLSHGYTEMTYFDALE